MLSYMVPSVVENKPPPAPKTRFQLDLENPRLTNGHAVVNGTDMLVTTAAPRAKPPAPPLSTESSASSLSSAGDLAPTHAAPATAPAAAPDKPRPAVKHQSLKRVSFGSSKGSMVETLIYESPVQEEPEISPSPDPSDPDSSAQSEAKHPSKVRVTFFEQEKPLVISSPEPELSEELDAPFVLSMTSASPVADNGAPYHRQTSTDSGWDNPFRPDGDLSREADEIVELIKGGKPITPTPATAVQATETTTATPAPSNLSAAAPNGSANPAPAKPGAVELQRATVAPGDASQVEHVVLKKKPKCKCCVIQ